MSSPEKSRFKGLLGDMAQLLSIIMCKLMCNVVECIEINRPSCGFYGSLCYIALYCNVYYIIKNR